MNEAEFLDKPLRTTGQHAGARYSFWTVIETRGAYSKCSCVCGDIKIRYTASIVTGLSKSCGCMAGALISASKVKHGHCKRSGETPEFRSWRMMRERCERLSHKFYHNYGGRGLRVCDRWKSFANFLEDMGPRPKGTSIDRIDGDKGYEPGNCIWSTRTVQNGHKRTSVTATIDGKTQCIAWWSRELGVPAKRAYARIAYGWTPEDALLK